MKDESRYGVMIRNPGWRHLSEDRCMGRGSGDVVEDRMRVFKSQPLATDWVFHRTLVLPQCL
jgi:hypothetical protein